VVSVTSSGLRIIAWCRAALRKANVLADTAQRDVIRAIYDSGRDLPVVRPPAAYLALLHVCGAEALRPGPKRQFTIDLFTLWNATGPDVHAVLKRDGDAVVYPELGTRYPAAA
jgi:hypothetical protein